MHAIVSQYMVTRANLFAVYTQLGYVDLRLYRRKKPKIELYLTDGFIVMINSGFLLVEIRIKM